MASSPALRFTSCAKENNKTTCNLQSPPTAAAAAAALHSTTTAAATSHAHAMMTSSVANKDNHLKEETLWSVFHKLKAVLDAPLVEKKMHQVTYDDSKRIVDMTEILPNLFIGDE